MFLACAWLATGACNKDESKDYRGLPPAESWQAPNPASSGSAPGAAATQGMGNPHAGMNMNDPHAGLDMNNPHAGMDMNDPHAGLNMNDPHAGLDMNNPHGGMGHPQGGMGDGGVDVTQLGLQPPDPARAIDPGKFLKGTIKPSAETRSRIAPGAVIFLSVKRADPATGQPTGAPLAVQRVPLSAWPLWFELTEADAMVSGTAFDGDVVITAWSDQDQDAISKQPGDVQGQVRAKIPAKDLVLVLDKVVQ